MEDKPIELKKLFERIAVVRTKITEMADLLEKEKRQRTEEEESQYQAWRNELDVLQMRIYIAGKSMIKDDRANAENKKTAEEMVRANLEGRRPTQLMLVRDLVMVADVTAGSIVPLKVGDFVKPLTEGLILDKVGIPFKTGLSGDYVWPVYEAVSASVMGEGVSLTDTEISLSKLTATPQRIGVAIPVTYQALNQTEGIVETIVRELMPQAVTMLLNKIMFSVDPVTNATTLKGPFTAKKSGATEVTKTPKLSELAEMKAKLLETGIEGSALCWVMTKSMKAVLETAPKDAGSGIMICENDHILGLPVFTTNYIRTSVTTGEGASKTTTVTEYIGLGDWRYQPMGLFGDISFIVDPYSKARENSVDFVLNANYGTVTLRSEAFALAKATKS